ncbi:MAG: DUF3052 domain-containing protein [Myxococcota bacterium]
MTAGYSKTPLVKKLGLKAGFTALTYHAPDHYFQLLEGLPEHVHFPTEYKGGEVDFIHLFFKEEEQLKEQLPRYKERLSKQGLLWVSWPKKASKVPTTVDEALVRREGLSLGLVDVKVCAVDEVWSGLKFVYRVKDR